MFLAGVNGLVAVIAGAYGWHFLTTSESGLRDIFMMGVNYQMWHALALLGVAWLAGQQPDSKALRVAGIAFVAGNVLFSGSLYALAMAGDTLVPGAAPAGGICLIVGWAAVVWSAFARRGA